MTYIHKIELEYTEIYLSAAGGIFMGGFPPYGEEVSKHFDVLVLCATENQEAVKYPGVRVLCAPGEDSLSTSPKVLDKWVETALRISSLCDQATVLVTCMAGHNRSGLVTALALIEMGFTPKRAIATIREKRPGALNNPHFCSIISKF